MASVFDITISVQAGVAKATKVTAKPGDNVNWVNNTGDRVILFFPHDGIFSLGSHFHHSIGKNGHHQPLTTIVAQPVAKKHCPYAIWCDATGTFAIGNSDPEIIVET
jgi:hypothetical protein